MVLCVNQSLGMGKGKIGQWHWQQKQQHPRLLLHVMLVGLQHRTCHQEAAATVAAPTAHST